MAEASDAAMVEGVEHAPKLTVTGVPLMVAVTAAGGPGLTQHCI
jgi:hypothetical protein